VSIVKIHTFFIFHGKKFWHIFKEMYVPQKGLICISGEPFWKLGTL